MVGLSLGSKTSVRDFSKVECATCGRDARLSASGLTARAAATAVHPADLETKPRCRECDPKGKAVGSRWGARPPS
jgi:hypothetical protein